jgi:hypothetical protein
MPNTMTLISSQILASPASSVTFSSIPTTYTDLKIVISTRVTRATSASTIVMVFNGSGGTAYSDKTLRGTGSAAESASSSSSADIRDMIAPAANAAANVFSNQEIYILNYNSASQYKLVSIESVSEDNASASSSNLTSGIWNNNSAITSITFSEPNGGTNFATNSTFYLYGIKNS